MTQSFNYMYTELHTALSLQMARLLSIILSTIAKYAQGPKYKCMIAYNGAHTHTHTHM